MSAELPVLRRIPGTYIYAFMCPGCLKTHYFRSLATLRCHQQWDWNGSLVAPTVNPSILYDAEKERRCHLFLTDGKVNFLGDCWHPLAGQTVSMIPYEEPV